MTNSAGVFQIADITQKEADTITMHCEINSEISLDKIVSAYRDENGTLCCSYENGRWYHYNEKGEWW
jgi:hypothetical protein